MLKAIAEADELGREGFLEKYDFGPSRSYFLRHDGTDYDSKAILGAARGYQYPDRGPLGAHDFSGGEKTVERALKRLGFDVVRRDEAEPSSRSSGVWIFQGNPDRFRVMDYLHAGLLRISWSVNRYSEAISVGDRVYIWQAAGKSKAALLRGSKTDPQRPLPTDPLTTDSVRRRPTKLSHLIEDVTCEDGLRLLPRPTARSKALPDDHLVPEEGVLHTGLLMVARVRLPLSPSSLLHLSDRAVARGRSWSPSRHGGCPGRWNDDRRATRTRSLVDATRVVGRVRREAGDVAFDLVDQIEGCRRVVNMPAGQGVSDDHARSVDAQMKLLPAAYTASAMFHGRPFTFTHSREPGTVDDEMYACARGEAAKCKVEVLTTP